MNSERERERGKKREEFRKRERNVKIERKECKRGKKERQKFSESKDKVIHYKNICKNDNKIRSYSNREYLLLSKILNMIL